MRPGAYKIQKFYKRGGLNFFIRTGKFKGFFGVFVKKPLQIVKNSQKGGV